MNDPVSAREALLIETIGEVAILIEAVDRLTPELKNASRAIDRSRESLHTSLAGFEAQILALTENAKVQTVKHILTRTEEAARRSVDFQSRAMAEAARLAFGTEMGATLQRLRTIIQPLVDKQQKREALLTHSAAFSCGAMMGMALAVFMPALVAALKAVV